MKTHATISGFIFNVAQGHFHSCSQRAALLQNTVYCSSNVLAQTSVPFPHLFYVDIISLVTSFSAVVTLGASFILFQSSLADAIIAPGLEQWVDMIANNRQTYGKQVK